MSNASDTRDATRQRAQNHFAASEQRDTAIKHEIARERAAVDARIAKQRAARLAKEAEEAQAAETAEAAPAAKPKKKAAPKAKKATRISV